MDERQQPQGVAGMILFQRARCLERHDRDLQRGAIARDSGQRASRSPRITAIEVNARRQRGSLRRELTAPEATLRPGERLQSILDAIETAQQLSPAKQRLLRERSPVRTIGDLGVERGGYLHLARTAGSIGAAHDVTDRL